MDCIITAIMLTAYYLHNSFFARNIIMYENWKYTAKKIGGQAKKGKEQCETAIKGIKIERNMCINVKFKK